MNDTLVQLEASKQVINCLIAMKGFKYKITMKVFLNKRKKKW